MDVIGAVARCQLEISSLERAVYISPVPVKLILSMDEVAIETHGSSDSSVKLWLARIVVGWIKQLNSSFKIQPLSLLYNCKSQHLQP